jgi:hypothetical protein
VFKRIDQSPTLSRFIEFVSSAIARQRGLPVVIGIAFILLSFIIQSVNILARSPLLEFIGITSLHIGLLAGLIGLLVSEALGK